jgi:hypothetical protein
LACLVAHAHAEDTENFLHHRHIRDGGQVFQRDGFVGEAGRRQHRQGFVLVALRKNFARQRHAASDAKQPILVNITHGV